MKASISTTWCITTLAAVLLITGTACGQAPLSTLKSPAPETPNDASPTASKLTAPQQDATQPVDADEGIATAQGDIIVTATRRSERLSRVPIAVSAVSGNQLAITGATDIRGLQQLAPSLTLNTTGSETASVARIRNIGTFGANFGLESSVATFIDGVFRARSGIALGELGDVERVEVLRGPQGTLFGRNASAGLINVVTQGPSSTLGGHARFDLGNYNERRFDGMLTGPIGRGDALEFRIQGIYEKRDGFFEDVVSGQRLNDRDRLFVRAQMRFRPSEDVTIRLISDFTDRQEQCCTGNFLHARTVSRDAAGNVGTAASPVAALARALGGIINDDPQRRIASITPGQSFASPVRDWGVSAQTDWNLGRATLTSITAYRDFSNPQALDPDSSNLDLLTRTRNLFALSNFSQEVRLQGDALGGRLDWLVGGFFASERAKNEDNLGVGSQYGIFQACQIASVLAGTSSAPSSRIISPISAGCIAPAARPLLAGALGGAATPLLTGLDRLSGFRNLTINDRFLQKGTNFALFTHNTLKLTDRLSFTGGLRWTRDKKSLVAQIDGAAGICGSQRASLSALTGAGVPASVQSLAGGLIAVSCASGLGDSTLNGNYSNSFTDSEFTGTAVLSFRPVNDLLTYASYSRGYKSGGYNLDRAGLSATTPVDQRGASLAFAPEFINNYEVGAKLTLPGFRLNVAGFHQDINGLQYSIFNGTNFQVINIDGCSQPSTPVAGILPTLGRCDGKTRSGAYSRGVEIEGSLFPARDVAVQAGFTLADTHFRSRLVTTGGASLPNGLALLPGSRVAYAPLFTVTTGATYTPVIGQSLKGLIHVDARLQSDFNTAADLFAEKAQDSFVLVNARVGLSSSTGSWSVEGWARNLLNTYYSNVIAAAPTQGTGTISYVQRGYASSATSLFVNLAGDPRTYGMTLRFAF